MQFCASFEENYSCLFIPNCTRNHAIAYTKLLGNIRIIRLHFEMIGALLRVTRGVSKMLRLF